MNIYIGENIKNLRKEKNITQEKLAEHLNISCQAVSKWERNESYPDITLVIPIASYFGGSTDVLLGVDNVKNAEKISIYLKEYDILSGNGKKKEKRDLIFKAYEEFPNDWLIIDKYMGMLVYDPYCKNSWGVPTHVDELEKLCMHVMDECTIDKIKYNALSYLGDVYKQRGQHDLAIALNERFPGIYHTRGEQYELSYEYGSVEWWYWIHYNINSLADTLIVKFRNCAINSTDEPNICIKQFMKAVDFIKLLYEDNDYGFAHYHLCELYIYIANRYIELNDYKNACIYLDLGLSHAKQYDELPDITKHTSFLIKNYVFDKREVYSGFENNDVMRELNYIDTNSFYDKVREMEDFKTIFDKYRSYAKSTKK